jgi:hypothetical protein
VIGWDWFGGRSENVPIQIIEPPKETPAHKVSRIISVSGRGDVPQGHHLWLFVYGPGAEKYFPQAMKAESATQSSDWNVTGINLGRLGEGDIGSTYTIYALSVDDSTDVRIRPFLAIQPEGGYDQKAWDDLFKYFEADHVEVQRCDLQTVKPGRC